MDQKEKLEIRTEDLFIQLLHFMDDFSHSQRSDFLTLLVACWDLPEERFGYLIGRLTEDLKNNPVNDDSSQNDVYDNAYYDAARRFGKHRICYCSALKRFLDDGAQDQRRNK